MSLDVMLVHALSPGKTTTMTTRTLLAREDVIQNDAHDGECDAVSGLEGYWGLGGNCRSLATSMIWLPSMQQSNNFEVSLVLCSSIATRRLHQYTMEAT